MNQWIKTIVGYYLISSIVMQMLPDKKYEQYVRLLFGILLLIFLLQPFLKISSADIYLESKVEEFVEEQERMESQIALEKEKIISDKTEILEIEEVKIEVEKID